MRENYDGHAGAKMREPKETQNDYLMLSRLSNLLKINIDKYLLDQNTVILDVGCGIKPYQPFFTGKSDIYLGCDIVNSELIDILCSGEKLPFRDQVISSILCTQVIEHVETPKRMVKEFSRVLLKNGLIFLSTHGTWPVHGAPYDYWRWTEYGLKKLFNKFNIFTIKECGGSIVSIFQLIELYFPPGLLSTVIIFFLNKLGDFLDNFIWLNSKLPRIVTTYLLVARAQF
jgi:SAM-dependent methyltransferase